MGSGVVPPLHRRPKPINPRRGASEAKRRADYAGALEVIGSQPGMFCDSRKHSWADLFDIVEGKNEILPAIAGKDTM